MAHRTSPPFRADHVGSLLRPERLRQARADHKAGTIDDAELRAVEDDAIREGLGHRLEDLHFVVAPSQIMSSTSNVSSITPYFCV